MLIETMILLTLASFVGLAKAGKDTGTKQATLFGEVVPLEQDKNADTVWVKIREKVKNVGDKLTFTMLRATYSAKINAIIIFDGEGRGTTLYFELHPENTFLANIADGVKLGRILTKKYGSIATPDDMATLINENEMVLTVEKRPLKTEGHPFVKWTVEYL